jgi:hypothetical protein
VSPLPRPSSQLPKTAPHLLRVDRGPEAFAPLIAAARELGLRVGWLELAAPAPLPADLETAAAAGALRAVAVGGGRSAALKPLRGEPVLRDLLREHFRGCALVLVRGEVAAPSLRPEGENWRIEPHAPDIAAARTLPVSDLAAALRRPRPW